MKGVAVQRLKSTVDKTQKITQTTNTKKRRGVLKQLEVRVTVGHVGDDIQSSVFDKLLEFAQQEADMAALALERGDYNLQLHIQAVVSIKNTSTRGLKADIAAPKGLGVTTPVGGSICVKALTNRGLHTLIGMVGYVLKDQDEEHFRLFSKNVTDIQMEEGKRRRFLRQI
ncbi:hypothetical protein R1flu_027727 [Riccia fluitans]|uniref:Replitron HUH endonuclease domain-containing protein n=1 Tax=Riccia fluitans TaxID=41844 RepID=A0ABD1XJN3_9MARC